MKCLSEYLIMAALVLVGAASCKEDPYFEAESPNAIEFTSDGGADIVLFSTNEDWTAESSASWCTISPKEGAGGKGVQVTVSCSTNENYDPRKCSVTITTPTNSFKVSVSQGLKKAVILSAETVRIDHKGGRFVLDAKYSVEYTMRIEGGDWLYAMETRSLSLESIPFFVKPNLRSEPRTATIHFDFGDSESTVLVEQGEFRHPVLEQTKPGFYGLDGYNLEYAPGITQISLLRDESGLSWRLIEPYTGSVASVSGLPEVITEETFACNVSLIADGEFKYTSNCEAQAVKSSGGLTWLILSDVAGIVVKL